MRKAVSILTLRAAGAAAISVSAPADPGAEPAAYSTTTDGHGRFRLSYGSPASGNPISN